jgi:hypothetical protein
VQALGGAGHGPDGARDVEHAEGRGLLPDRLHEGQGRTHVASRGRVRDGGEEEEAGGGGGVGRRRRRGGRCALPRLSRAPAGGARAGEGRGPADDADAGRRAVVAHRERAHDLGERNVAKGVGDGGAHRGEEVGGRDLGEREGALP